MDSERQNKTIKIFYKKCRYPIPHVKLFHTSFIILNAKKIYENIRENSKEDIIISNNIQGENPIHP